jgi:hypothetical protein
VEAGVDKRLIGAIQSAGQDEDQGDAALLLVDEAEDWAEGKAAVELPAAAGRAIALSSCGRLARRHRLGDRAVVRSPAECVARARPVAVSA